MSEQKSVRVIINAAAGSLQGQEPAAVADHIRSAFAEAGMTVSVRPAKGRAILREIRNAAQDAGIGTLIIGGGDGSVAYAGGLLAGTDKVLGVLPLGTLNLVARDLGMPLDMDEAIAVLAQARPRPMDVASVNGRIFLSNSGLGFFAHMARQREKQRGLPRLGKWHAWFSALLNAVSLAEPMHVDIDDGGEKRRHAARAVLVTNNAFDPDSLFRKDDLTGGRLAVHIATHRNRAGLVRTFFRLLAGRWHDDPELEVLESPALRIGGRRRHAWVSADGEFWLAKLPLDYRIMPAALTVLGPAAAEPPQAEKAGD